MHDKFKLACTVYKLTWPPTAFIFVFAPFKRSLTEAVCPVNSGLVPELPSTPQEAREPQPHLQHPHDLAAAQRPVPAHPDPWGAAVHSLRRPGGINALCTTLLHRQWASAVSWRFIVSYRSHMDLLKTKFTCKMCFRWNTKRQKLVINCLHLYNKNYLIIIVFNKYH